MRARRSSTCRSAPRRTTCCSPPRRASASASRSTDVRVFQGRTSMGVRGINLAEGDKVISLSILGHVERQRRGARGVSQARERGAPRPERRRAGGVTPEVEEDAGHDRAWREALCRAVGRGAVRADGVGERLRQAHVVLSNTGPPAAAAKASPRWSVTGKTGRLRRVVPGRGERPDHAGDRRRAVDPLPGERHPHRRPLDARA